MDVFDAIYRRRAIKEFDASHEMPAGDVQRLMEAAIQSPTSFNLQHWRFVLVRDRTLREQLREAAYQQPQVTDASLLIVVAADLKAWAHSPERYWRHAPQNVCARNISAIKRAYAGHEQLERDEAMRSCGLAGMAILLAAQALGYDSCPMVGFEPEKVSQIVRLPADHVVSFLIAVGKAARPPWPKPGQLPLSEVAIQDRFEPPRTATTDRAQQ